MAMAFVVGNTILIVLDEENIERIQANDPFDLDMKKMGTMTLPIPFRISICYARKDEQEKIVAIREKEGIEAVLKYLSRGFKVTASDHDRPYERCAQH
jgi:hypothetical protein